MYGSLSQKRAGEEKKRTAAPPRAGMRGPMVWRPQGGPSINIAPLAPVRLSYTGPAGPAPSTRADRGAQRKIAGITHTVKQRQGPASLFHGQVTRELRQGQVVTIDEGDVFLSRRGPNQELFRAEDRQKKPSYRWYRLLAVGEEPVPEAEQPSYVRADTLVALERPLPEWGDAVTPGDRMGGRVTDTGALSLGQRQLNRIGRLIWAAGAAGSENKPTPHVAVTYYNGALLVQGNSDYPPISAVPPERFGTLGNTLTGGRKRKIDRARAKAARLFSGTYHETEVRADPLLGAARRVLRGEDRAWRVSDRTTEKPVSEHGEMTVLERIVQEEEAKPQGRPDPRPRRRLRQLYIGGTLLDCLFCHWAFSIFNRFLSKRYGLYVVTSGTHGYAPPQWVIPRWIRSNGAALGALQRNLASLNEARGVHPYVIEGGMIKTDLSSPMRDTMGDNSDSEADPKA